MTNTQSKNISEADAAKVEAFKDLITIGTNSDSLRKGLTNIFVKYTRLLLKDDVITKDADTDTELYYLSELIALLDEAKP